MFNPVFISFCFIGIIIIAIIISVFQGDKIYDLIIKFLNNFKEEKGEEKSNEEN